MTTEQESTATQIEAAKQSILAGRAGRAAAAKIEAGDLVGAYALLDDATVHFARYTILAFWSGMPQPTAATYAAAGKQL